MMMIYNVWGTKDRSDTYALVRAKNKNDAKKLFFNKTRAVAQSVDLLAQSAFDNGMVCDDDMKRLRAGRAIYIYAEGT